MLGLVLAAGRGVRMRPLSLDRPKPLIPILDVPQLVWALARLRSAHVMDAWVNAHSESDRIFNEAQEAAERLGLRLRVSHEPENPLGSAGALRKVAEGDQAVLVTNSDVATDLPLEKLIEAHRSAGGIATLLAIPADEEADLVIEEGWVTELIEKRDWPRAGYRYGGTGIFESEALRYIPYGASGLFETVMAAALRDRAGLAAFEWDGYWMDVGTPAAHLRVNLDALSGAFELREIPQLAGQNPLKWDGLSYVASGARVDDVVLRHAVVGRGAKVEPETRLERCVVWDGSVVKRGDYRDAVITEKRVVSLD
jgi:NDP-sugar pyrophosphorylase family protein